LLVGALPALAAARGPDQRASGPMVQVVLELRAPSASRSQLPRSRGRLDLDSPATLRRLVQLRIEQSQVETRVLAAVPRAEIRWRYSIVLNGLTVLVPQGSVEQLADIVGVAEVYRSSSYRATLDRSPAAIGAPALWGPGLSTAGQGMKIGIVDDGIDHRHAFFDPAGYTMPPGFPKGQPAFTTAKVIASRVFPAPSPRPRNAGLPFDEAESEHATHVAGIAAGNNGTPAPSGGTVVRLSGVAPRAYLGNYRVLTVPTASNVGLDGNSPEIAAGIEAAVRDGMDVVNLSLGEPEIPVGRDIVIRAIDGAAAAGVVPVVSAGNDFTSFGRGSVSSPGAAESAITVGATSVGGQVAGFSSAGPTPISLRLKPEVSAPGVGIVSSVPARRGTWEALSGTSMAAPHVAGAAAVLRQRHPTWTPGQVKSALTTTGRPARDGSRGEALTTRQGGGVIDLVRADRPLLFASPTAVSLGFARRGRTVQRSGQLIDAGGGAGEWSVSLTTQGRSPGVSLATPSRVTVPGPFRLALRASAAAPGGDVTGFLVLQRAAEVRRIPFWGRVTVPRLGRHPARALRRTGTYGGNTRGRRALVAAYRYPENPSGAGITRILAGPEEVFRVRLSRPAANFGVAILDRRRGVTVQPRIVLGEDEDRLAGPTALPLNTNPYLPTFLDSELVSGVIRPAAGSYSVVFDSARRSGAGRFRFRFWVGDETPPRVRLLTRSVRSGTRLALVASDGGAGVDPAAIFASVDGVSRTPFYTVSRGRIRIEVPIGSLRRGRHRLVIQVSDHQEAKNMENALRILPNTTVRALAFTVR